MVEVEAAWVGRNIAVFSGIMMTSSKDGEIVGGFSHSGVYVMCSFPAPFLLFFFFFEGEGGSEHRFSGD